MKLTTFSSPFPFCSLFSVKPVSSLEAAHKYKQAQDRQLLSDSSATRDQRANCYHKKNLERQTGRPRESSPLEQASHGEQWPLPRAAGNPRSTVCRPEGKNPQSSMLCTRRPAPCSCSNQATYRRASLTHLYLKHVFTSVCLPEKRVSQVFSHNNLN